MYVCLLTHAHVHTHTHTYTYILHAYSAILKP